MSRQFVPNPNKNKKILTVIFLMILVGLFCFPKTREAFRDFGRMIGIGSVRTIDIGGDALSGLDETLVTKKSLIKDKEVLSGRISELEAKFANYSALIAENNELKKALSREDKMHFTLASILAKPGVSMYDTLIVDAGLNANVIAGKTVYANGETPIGKVETVYEKSSLVRLFSSNAEKTEMRLDAISEDGKAIHLDVEVIGKGGGNFVVSVPHDFSVGANLVARTKDINPKVIATYQKIISDARDPFLKILLSSPVNVHELSFVEIEQ